MGKKTLKDLFQQRCKPSEAISENIQPSSEVAETLPQQQPEGSTKRKEQFQYPENESEVQAIDVQNVNQKKEKTKWSQEHQSYHKKVQELSKLTHQVNLRSVQIVPAQHYQCPMEVQGIAGILHQNLVQQISINSQGKQCRKQSIQVKVISKEKQDIDEVNLHAKQQLPSQKEQDKSLQIKEQKSNKRKSKAKNNEQKTELPKRSQRNLRPKNDQINYKESFNSSLIRVPNFNQSMRQKSEANKGALNQQKNSLQQFSQNKLQAQELRKMYSNNQQKMDVQSQIQASLNGQNNVGKQSKHINGQNNAFETPVKPFKNKNSNNKNKARENYKNTQNAQKTQNYNSIFNQIRARVVYNIRQQMAQNNQAANKPSTLNNLPSSQEMPQLALRCAEFFHSLSKYCLNYYQNYNREQANQKTKKIHKLARPKKLKLFNRNGDRNDGDKKNEKDQALPKKPLTAYIIYFQEKKPSFVEKYKGLNLSELTKLIAKQWTELSQLEKQPYLDKASEDRRRYQQEMAEYRRKCGTIANMINQMGQASENNEEDIIQAPGDEKDKNQGAIQIQQ